MSSYRLYVAKGFIREWLLVVVLIFALFVTSIYAFSKENKTILIGIDQNGTRIVTQEDDPIFKTEVINFIRNFVALAYNFDQESFDTNAQQYTEWLSVSLWNDKRDDLFRVSQEIKKDPIQMASIVTKITKEKDKDGFDIYKVHLNQTLSRRARTEELKYIVSMRISKSAGRTEKNPFGYEVDSLEETRVTE